MCAEEFPFPFGRLVRFLFVVFTYRHPFPPLPSLLESSSCDETVLFVEPMVSVHPLQTAHNIRRYAPGVSVAYHESISRLLVTEE